MDGEYPLEIRIDIIEIDSEILFSFDYGYYTIITLLA